MSVGETARWEYVLLDGTAAGRKCKRENILTDRHLDVDDIG